MLLHKKNKAFMTQEEKTKIEEKIVDVLKTVYDPEIPVDIYELGLIYDVMVNEDYEVKILMTLTSPNCPVAETLPLFLTLSITKPTILSTPKSDSSKYVLYKSPDT